MTRHILSRLCERCRPDANKWIHIEPKTAREIAAATGRPAFHTITSQLEIIETICKRDHPGYRPEQTDHKGQ